MGVLRRLGLTALGIFLLAACDSPEQVRYVNSDLGLKLHYPAYWQQLDAEQVAAGIAASTAQMEASAETLAQAQAVTSGLQLSVVRPESKPDNPGGASLNVVAISVPEDEWPGLDLATIVAGQMQGVAALPGATTRRLGKGRLPERMKGYLAVLPTQQGNLYQYQLSYWQQPYYVQLILSSLTESDRELAAIIDSLQLGSDRED